MNYKNHFIEFNGYSEKIYPSIGKAINSALNFLIKHQDFKVELFCGDKLISTLDKNILKSLKPSKIT